MHKIRLKTGKNFRDLGGNYKNGVCIKYKHLLRGTKTCNLSEEDLQTLRDKYNLKILLDLRSTDEKNRRPDKVIDGITSIHIPVFEQNRDGITHDQNGTNYRTVPPMEKLYYEMFHKDQLEQISKIIKFIINLDESDYSILIHCSEGKDRTGIICLIILMLLGISKNEAIKDYLYTNKVNRPKARRISIKTLIKEKDIKYARKIRKIFLASRKYIDQLFKVITEEYNDSFDVFRTNGLKISDEELSILKEKLLVNNLTKNIN